MERKRIAVFITYIAYKISLWPPFFLPSPTPPRFTAQSIKMLPEWWPRDRSSPILEILSSFGLQDTTFSWFSSYLTSHFFSVFFCWLLLSSSFHFGKILGFLLFIISSLIMLPRYRVSNTNHTLTPPNVDLQSGSLS